MEFRRGVMQSFAYVQTLLRQIQREGRFLLNIGDFLVRLSESPSIFRSPRAIQRSMLVSSVLFNEFRSDIFPIEDALDFLDFQILQLEKDGFFEGIDELVNPTDCDLSKPQAPLGDLISSRLSCNAATAQCKLVKFLESQKPKLSRIENTLAGLPMAQRDQRAFSALQRIQTDITKTLGERTCWALSDIIIALESPEDARIYTVDEHFRSICLALGKSLF